VIVGSGIGGMDTIVNQLVPLVKEGKVRRLGSRIVEQVMNSGTSAFIAGHLALGNQATSNSSACSTGNEALIEGMWKIRMGLAKRMLTGRFGGVVPLHLGRFRGHAGHLPEVQRPTGKGSRPMSATACGFVPGSGGGVLAPRRSSRAPWNGAPGSSRRRSSAAPSIAVAIAWAAQSRLRTPKG